MPASIFRPMGCRESLHQHRPALISFRTSPRETFVARFTNSLRISLKTRSAMGISSLLRTLNGTSIATGSPWQVMVISSPDSTRSKSWPNRFFASKAEMMAV